MTNNREQPDRLLSQRRALVGFPDVKSATRQTATRSIPPFHETNADTPKIGGGLPVIQYWAEHTLSPEGPALWKTLLHHSACLSCSWGTGGQKGGFTNESGEKVQRCMKSVEAITSELQPPVPRSFFERFSIPELQQLTSMIDIWFTMTIYVPIPKAGK
jgi:hypothetical protein